MNPSFQALSEKLNDPELTETLLPDGTGVLLDPQGHQVLSLSKTAVFLVQQVRDGVAVADGLAESLTAKYDVSRDVAQRDTAEFLADLSQALFGQGPSDSFRS